MDNAEEALHPPQGLLGRMHGAEEALPAFGREARLLVEVPAHVVEIHDEALLLYVQEAFSKTWTHSAIVWPCLRCRRL